MFTLRTAETDSWSVQGDISWKSYNQCGHSYDCLEKIWGKESRTYQIHNTGYYQSFNKTHAEECIIIAMSEVTKLGHIKLLLQQRGEIIS